MQSWLQSPWLVITASSSFFFLLFFRTFHTSQETDGIVSRAKRDMRTSPLIDQFHILRFPDHPHRRDNLLKIIVSEMAGGYLISDLRRRYQNIWSKKKRKLRFLVPHITIICLVADPRYTTYGRGFDTYAVTSDLMLKSLVLEGHHRGHERQRNTPVILTAYSFFSPAFFLFPQ